jgi:hypothetical protein
MIFTTLFVTMAFGLFELVMGLKLPNGAPELKLLNQLDSLLGIPFLILFLMGVLVWLSSWFTPRDR